MISLNEIRPKHVHPINPIKQIREIKNSSRDNIVRTMRHYIPEIILESLHLEKPNKQSSIEKINPALVSTLPKTLAYRVSKTPNAPAFYYPDEKGLMKGISWAGVNERVKNISGGLKQLGLEQGETAAIFSPTRLDWILSDLAINSSGCTTCAVMPGNRKQQLSHILNDSQSKIVFVENDEQLAKIMEIRNQLPHVTKVINFTGTSNSNDGWVVSGAEVEKLGKDWNASNPGKFEKDSMAVKPEDIATLIYTSGTTGVPKGVELQHKAWATQQNAVANLGMLSDKDKQYLWLPMGHSFGKFLLCASLQLGLPTVIDGNPKNIAKGLESTHPTFTAAVPLVYEKIYNGIMSKSKEKNIVERQIFNWAMHVGRKVSEIHEKGGRPDIVLATEYALADTLVFSKIRSKFGGNLKVLLSGGAPLSKEVARGLDAIGLRVMEGYGLTETSGANIVNRPHLYKFGSVGTPMPGVTLKLSDSPENKGEILLKGDFVMKGYHNLPEKTRETFTPDGFFKTGDIGTLDQKGNLHITDRVKNIFKLSTGEYVAPAPMEQGIKDEGKGLVNNVLVHGYNRKFCTAIITLDDDALKKWGLSVDSIAHNSNPKIRAEVEKMVDHMNHKLNLTGSSAVCKFYIAPSDFDVGSELTETQKVIRNAVESKYSAQLDALYAIENAKIPRTADTNTTEQVYKLKFA